MKENNYAIDIKKLQKVYHSVSRKRYEALKSIDLNIEQGEIFGFLGPNGAGKTTTIKIITGLIYPTGGTVSIFGYPISDVRYRRFLGYLPERPCFYENLSGIELVQYYGRLFGLSPKDSLKKAEGLVELVGLKESKHLPISSYSQGMNQKLGLAQALIGDPKLLVLDEPMSGLDPIARRQVRELLLGLKKKGVTIFFSSHILYDVEMFCDRVAIIKSGKILLEMDIASLLDRSILGYEVVVVSVTKDAKEQLDKVGVSYSERLGHMHILADTINKKKVLEILHSTNTEIISFLPKKQSLEDAFIEEISVNKV